MSKKKQQLGYDKLAKKLHENNNFFHTEFWVRAKILFISFTLGGPQLKLIIYLAKL